MYGQNTNPRELRNIAKVEGTEDLNMDDLHDAVHERAVEFINKTDFEPLDHFLHEDFGRNQLSGWLHQQFGLAIPPSAFNIHEEPEKAIPLVMEKLRERYDEQDARFPVIISLMRFQGTATTPADRDGLIRWANNRFRCQLDAEALQSLSIEATAEKILAASRDFLPKDDITAQVNGFLAKAFPSIKGKPGPLVNPDALRELHDFVFRRFETELDLDVLKQQPQETTKIEALKAYEMKYRPEMGQAERQVLLELLDNSWKEHLYHMDFLRQNVGLVGYAQKDPKVEYKRQGMKEFDAMWDRIGEAATSAVFRLERESDPRFLRDVWHETAAVHESAAPIVTEAVAAPQPSNIQETGTLQPGQAPTAVEPIRNREKKVGRNDPCPCGSGKKYKNCHGGA
jgi:preprotein translocase subunit SecA